MILMISGFLGSGKTTLIVKLAKHLQQNGFGKLVVIENEVGEIGIDNLYLEMAGLQVRELFSGCVCCQLAGDLVETLDKVYESISPDLVIVEPSGVAEPGKLAEVAREFSRFPTPIAILNLIDASRFDALHEVMTPFLEACVHNADVVAISKIDLIDREELDRIKNILTEMAQTTPIVPLSEKDDDSVVALATLLLRVPA